MASARGLGLLLLLLLPTIGKGGPSTVVRINQAALSYVSDVGKAALQQALRVTVPSLLDLDESGEVLRATRIQLLRVRVSSLHLRLLAELGLRLSAAANFTFQVLRVTEPLELTLPMVLQADAHVAQGSIGTPVVSVSACSSVFGTATMPGAKNSLIQMTLPFETRFPVLGDGPSPALLAHVQTHIQAAMNSKLCLRVSNLVQDLNVHLGTLIGLTPVGPESQIRYTMVSAPTVTSDDISLDIDAALFLLGTPIVLPENTTPFALPRHGGARDAMATVGLSQHLFDSALLLLQKAGALNLDVTGQLNSADNPLNTSVLGQLIPEVAHQFPEPMPLVLKVQLGATPVVTLHTNNATLRLQPLVEVLAMASNSAFQSLFSLDVVVNLSLQLSVSKVKLQGTTSVLGDVQVTVASSNVGSIDPAQVHSLMGTVFEKPLLDHLNALLGMGIALPSVVNLCYSNPEVFVHEGYVVISSGLLYQH